MEDNHGSSVATLIYVTTYFDKSKEEIYYSFSSTKLR